MLHSRERRRSCRIDFLLGRREGERGGEEKKNERREKRMEEIPVPEGKLQQQQQQHHRRRPFPPTFNVSSGNKNKKADGCGGIDC